MALLDSTPASTIIAGVGPHMVCATADIQQLAEEITAIFLAKASMIEGGDAMLDDISFVLDAVNEFEEQSIYLCTNVRVAARKLLNGNSAREVFIDPIFALYLLK